MNTIYQFAKEVAEKIKEYLPEEYQDVKSQTARISVINGGYKDAVRLQRNGETGFMTMSLGSYFEAYKQGVPLDVVMKEAAAGAAKHLESVSRTLTKLESFENVKDLLSPVLVNTKRNFEMLQDMPHMRIEDLSVICQIELPGQDGIGSIKVNHGHLKQWGIKKEELFSQLLENMQKPGTYILQDAEKCSDSISGEGNQQANLLDVPDCCLKEKPGQKTPARGDMYILFNRKRIYGAAAIVCPGVMEKVNRLFPDGYYILPASVHECMIVPKLSVFSTGQLRDMVSEINVTVLQNEEILSDHIYEYNRERGRIQQAPTCYEKNRGFER